MLSMHHAVRLWLVLVASLDLAGCIACGGVHVDRAANLPTAPYLRRHGRRTLCGNRLGPCYPSILPRKRPMAGRATCSTPAIFSKAHRPSTTPTATQSRRALPPILHPRDFHSRRQRVERRPDPDLTWVLWARDFMNFFEQYPDAPKVARQEGRPENIAWLDEGVFFMGINLVGGRMHDVEEAGSTTAPMPSGWSEI